MILQNGNEIKFKDSIQFQLKKNGMQIGAKGFENFLFIMELKKIKLIETNMENHLSMPLYSEIS